MEFNPNVLKLHGAILSLGNRGLLNNLGCSETIKVLKDVFEHASDRAKSQMTLLMLLNSDLSCLSLLENDENLCLFTKVLPVITKKVLIELIFELNLQSYLYEVIKNCHSSFTDEIIDNTLDYFMSLNLLEKEYDVVHLYHFWTALFVKMHNINQGFHKDAGSGILMTYFGELCNHIQRTVLLSFEPNASDEYLYVGTHLYHFFDQVLYFLMVVNNENYTFEQDEFYDFTFHLKDEKGNNGEQPSFMSIATVFKSLHKIMNCFTVKFWEGLDDLFLEFSSNFSLQKLIGHSIYRICEELSMLNSQLSSYVTDTSLQYLSEYKIKPKSKVEIYSEESITTIMKNVDEGVDSEKWFKALLPHYPSNYTLVIDCIMRNLYLSDGDGINFLLENTLQFMKKEENENNLNCLRKFFAQAFKHTHSDRDNEFWYEKTLDLRHGLLKTETFDSQLIEVFNKLDRYYCNKQQSEVQKELVWCCMQSPQETLLKFCQIVLGSRDSKQVSLCCNVLRDLEFVCNARSAQSEDLKTFEEIVLEVIRSGQHETSENRLFLSFLTELSKGNFIGCKFFEEILNLIVLYVQEGRFKEVRFPLEIVESCQPYQLSHFSKPALLVFVCQILPPLSWKAETFSHYKSESKKICHHIIVDIISQLKNEDNGDELEWAREEISKFEEIHQSYFCDLWLKFNRRWPSSGSFRATLLALLCTSEDVEPILMKLREHLRLEKSPAHAKAFLVLSVNALLPQLYDENQWRRLDQVLAMLLSECRNINCDGLNVLELFSSSMFLMAVSLNENVNIYDSFKFCLSNFERLRFYDKISDDDFCDVLDFLEKITFPVQAIEHIKYREACSYLVIGTMFKFMDKMCKGKMLLYEMKVKELFRVLNVKRFEELVRRRIASKTLLLAQK